MWLVVWMLTDPEAHMLLLGDGCFAAAVQAVDWVAAGSERSCLRRVLVPMLMPACGKQTVCLPHSCPTSRAAGFLGM